MEIAVYILLGCGLFINAMSVVGLLRFPDIYTRLHAATKTTTFGSIFIVAAVIVHSILVDDAASLTIIMHSAIALVVVIFTNPISAHAIARAALYFGIKPYGVVINDLSEKQKQARRRKA
ncbi:MAG TPA: monovalent cation/H(+) antiporter subunit G [Spirochaetota bacterium]|nr:monovalent cation/H(+) antiporter subunit G [Spirochaetota bacterium]HPJ38010.1 monovalent cation/H(+) antiporter subunit G [Spirochaetota bacterium]HPQ53857.1 monovalent cation/H(+) antiporter subunit G [Spirochaetota bacterium]